VLKVVRGSPDNQQTGAVTDKTRLTLSAKDLHSLYVKPLSPGRQEFEQQEAHRRSVDVGD